MEEKDRHIITFDTDIEDDQPPKEEPVAENPEFVMKPSEPEVSGAEPASVDGTFNMEPEKDAEKPAVEGAGFTMKPDETEAAPVVEGAGFTMTPSEPAEKPASSAFSMNPDKPEDKAQDLKRDFDSIKTDVKVSMSQDAARAASGAAPATSAQAAPSPEIKSSTTVAGGSGAAAREGGSHYAQQGGSHYAQQGGGHYAQKPAKPKKEKKYVTRGTLIGCMILTMLLSTFLGSLLGGSMSSNNPDSRTERDDSKLSQLNLSDATGSEMTVSEIVEKNADAVVEIVVSGTTQGMWGQMQLTEGAGSGVIIRKDGYIATNYHVIQGANKVQVTLHNGEAYPAQIIGSDPANDVAVIKIDEKDLTTAVIGDSSKVAVGDLAVAIGNPLGQLGGTATTGIISALDRTLSVEGTTLTLLQTDAAINGGNSGGGLFNSKGELIGIVESKAAAVGVEGLAFALPINSVSEILNDIIESGGNVSSRTAGTPAVGIVISDVSEEQSQYYGLEEPGVYIAQVTGDNALRAGFKEQDRIVSFNGTEVKDSSTFITLVRKCKVGDTVTIVVSRDGQEIEIKTELEELQTNQ